MNNIFDSFTPVKQITLEKNEYLFHQGDEVKYLYLINDGRIRMLRLTLDGKESVMYEGSSGDTFAEASLFAEHYHCDAIAVQKSTIDVFKKSTLQDNLKNNPQLSTTYMSLFARQVQQLRTHLELRNIKSAHERIYQYFVLNTDSTGKVVLTSSLKDLAHQLGLAHETFYRALNTLEKDKLISREDDGNILISPV